MCEQDNLMITIINKDGSIVKMTTAEWKKQQRKAKAAKKRKATTNAIRLLPSEIKAVMANLKVLRSIVAYYHHGYRQWGRIARDIINMPTIHTPFLNLVCQIGEVNQTIGDIETIAKKGEKAVFQYVEKLQYRLKETQSLLDILLHEITKNGVLSSPMQKHECICGTGRRLGLRVLVQRGDKAISEIGRIVGKLEDISTKGVDPMLYHLNGRVSA